MCLNPRLTGWEGGRGRERDIQEGRRWKKVKERARPVSRLRSAEEKGTVSTFPENKKQLVKRFLKHTFESENRHLFFSSESKVQSNIYLLQEKNHTYAHENTRGLKQFVFGRIECECLKKWSGLEKGL